MSAVVIVGESDTSLVVTAGQHTRWCLFLSELLGVLWVVSGVGREAADHFLVLADADPLALDGLNVLETREDLVVDGKDDFHLVGGTFLDGEWVFAKSFKRTRFRKIDGDVGTTLDLLGFSVSGNQRRKTEGRLTSARDLMMQVRLSFGSPIGLPPLSPRDCLYRCIASSSASNAEVSQVLIKRLAASRLGDRGESWNCEQGTIDPATATNCRTPLFSLSCGRRDDSEVLLVCSS
jgi:hypothetical protein